MIYICNRFCIYLMLISVFFLGSNSYFNPLSAQATVTLTVNNGVSTTTCGDVFGSPDPMWAVNVASEGWEHYPETGICFNNTPNQQFSRNITCHSELSTITVCFKAYENDGAFCNTNEKCLETICADFDVPTSGSADYLLGIPPGGTSGGAIGFTITTTGTFEDQGNDDMCGAIDFGVLENGQQLGDAMQGTFNNICANGSGEPNTFADGLGWGNDFSVWFTFTTSANPGSVISILGLSDPENTGDFLSIQMALYQSTTADCTGDFEVVTSSWDNSTEDESMTPNCLEPNRTYYIMIDGFIPPPTTRFDGVFGLQVRDENILEAPDQRCEAMSLGPVPDGGAINTGLSWSNFCATGDPADPATGLFNADHSVWFSFVAPASRHITLQANSDNNENNGGFGAVDLQVAVFESTNNQCDNNFDLTSADYSSGSFNENTELSCLTPGATYYIMVNGGPDDRTGVFSLNIADAGYDPVIEQLDAVRCFGDTLFAGNDIVTNDGPYEIRLLTTAGCDSLIQGTLTILPENRMQNDLLVCAGEGINIGNNYYNATGTYEDVLPAFNGCDSIIRTNLFVVPEMNLEVSQTVEATAYQVPDGEAVVNVSGGISPHTYLWDNGENTPAVSNLTGGSTYCVTVTDATGCTIEDCVLVLFPSNILVNIENDLLNCPDDTDGSLSFDISNGVVPYTYIWENADASLSGSGTVNTEGEQIVLNNLLAGNYGFTITDAFGIKVAEAEVIAPDPIVTTLEENLCFGTVLNVGNAVYSSSGPVMEILTAANGCDSTVTGNVIFQQQNQTTIEETICFGESISVGNVIYQSTGPIQETLTDVMGCDSVVTGMLIVQNEITTILNEVRCFGESLVVGTSSYSTSGPINENLISFQGCDSAVIGNLLILPDYQTTAAAQICGGDSLIVGSSVYTTTGTYTDNFISSANCDSTVTTVLTVNAPLTISGNLDMEASAYQVADGTASVTAGGGDGNYNYQWDNGTTTAVATNLLGGNTYCVTVTDNTGCSIEDCVLVLFPSNIQTTISNDLLTCFGDTDGSLSLSVFNGVVPYSYTWEKGDNSLSGNGTVDTEGGTEIINNLPGGTYNFNITDAFGSTTTTALVIEPQPILTVLEETICFGDSLQVGTVFYKNNGPFNETLTSFAGCDSIVAGLLIIRPVNNQVIDETICFGDSLLVGNTYYKTAGPVAETLTDIFGCDSMVTGNLNILPAIITTVNPSICFGETYTNGSGAYQNTGMYQEVFTATNGCDSLVNINLTVLGDLDVIADLGAAASGLGTADGSADATVSGGSGNVSYLWSNGSTSPVIDNLTGGETYCITVTDLDGGCTSEDCVVILFPVNIITEINAYTLDCFGAADGQLSFTVSNGQAPYNFSWTSDLGTSGSGVVASEGGTGLITDLAAGNYQITVSDIWGETTLSGSVINPEIIAITETNNEPASCFSSCDGALELNVSGGTAPYQFLWPDGQTGATAIGLCAGNYPVTITDANNCVASQVFAIAEPFPIEIQIFESQSVSCFGSDNGQAVITTNQDPVTYLWDNGETTSEALSLSGGLHTVTVTNPTGCTAVGEVTIQAPAAGITVVIEEVKPISCSDAADGEIIAQVSNGLGTINYEWTDGSTTAGLTDIGGGNYALTVTDQNGCTVETDYTLTTANPIIPVFSVTDITCLDSDNAGQLEVESVTGGNAPFLFSLDPGSGFSTSQNFGFLHAGNYELYIEDMAGCLTAFPFTVGGPDPLTVDLGGDQHIELGEEVRLTAESGGSNLLYEWNVLDTADCMNCPELNLSPDFTARYEVKITDTLTKCIATDDILITVEKPRRVYIPNVFSPNADGQNDSFQIYTGQDVERVLILEVFNRWGAKVYAARDIDNGAFVGWDGRIGGQRAEAGVYIYRAEVLFKDGIRKAYNGDISLVR